MSKHQTIIVDAGATYTRIGTHSCKNNPDIVVQNQNSTEKYELVLKLLTEYITKKKIKKPRVIIGTSGLIDNNGRIYDPVNPRVISIDIKMKFESHLSCPVTVFNDAKLQAMAYCDQFRTLLYIVFGTGVGGAIISNRKIFMGSNGFAGELVHLPLQSSKISCKCGRNSCLEASASGKYLSERFGNNWWENISQECSEYLTTIGSQCGELAFRLSWLINPSAIIFAGHIAGIKQFSKALLTEPQKQLLPYKTVLAPNTWNSTLKGAFNIINLLDSNDELFC